MLNDVCAILQSQSPAPAARSLKVTGRGRRCDLSPAVGGSSRDLPGDGRDGMSQAARRPRALHNTTSEAAVRHATVTPPTLASQLIGGSVRLLLRAPPGLAASISRGMYDVILTAASVGCVEKMDKTSEQTWA